MNFSEVRNELVHVPGLNPGRLMNFGEQRISHAGKVLEGTYFDSRWGFDFGTSAEWCRSENQSAVDAIDDILSKLEPYKKMFDDLSKSGCDIELILAISVSGNTGEVFKTKLLQRLSEFKISLGFDLYPDKSGAM